MEDKLKDSGDAATTDKLSARMLAQLLAAHGVDHAVLSPGSRNAPLLMALERCVGLKCHVVIDERSAAFMALGMSVESGEPVALCCTSGTALLNYAPAVAEAYYRRVPLVVVSADRPEEWIDQDDSQTIWQQDALKPYVKRRCDISARVDFTNGPWWVNRVINDALLEAVRPSPGPVHINIRLDAPLNGVTHVSKADSRQRIIGQMSPHEELSPSQIRELSARLSPPLRVMIVAGFMQPDPILNEALSRLAGLQNVAVLTETISNQRNPLFVSRIDATLCRLTEEERLTMRPDVVITIGGALVSRHIKEWLRSLPPEAEHWHIGHTHTTVDCFKHLTLRVEMAPGAFMSQLAPAVSDNAVPYGCSYAETWHRAAIRAAAIHDRIITLAPWCDLSAMAEIFRMIPPDWHLHLSNGTPIRYAQLMDCSHILRSDYNRGVSGIDGCTSTAIGASAVYDGVVLLITGDMSFQYDLGALASQLLSGRMKMVVMMNGGGSIFRFIASTRHLPELERDFAVGTRLPLWQLCDGYGIDCYEVSDAGSLRKAWTSFASPGPRPALLAVHTSGPLSAQVLTDYFTDRLPAAGLQ